MDQIGTGSASVEVFRDVVKERRDTYYVTYQPADSRLPYAILNLVYPKTVPDGEQVAEQMKQEMTLWLSRFPVPVIVSAFDAADNCLEVHADASNSQLIGFVDPLTSKVVIRWGTFSERELPADQSTPEYLANIYDKVPFRSKAQVRQQVEEKAAQFRRGLRLFRIASVFWVGIPLLIEIVSLGVNWIGYALWSISVSIGLFKFAKVIGWIRPSQRQIATDEEMRKMKHYFYHCERNPAGFERLKIENFERDALQETQNEFDSLPTLSKPSD
jgi:hypothetical protein